jgi:hypothetical protein
VIKLITNSKAFEKDMKNIIDYSVGFLDGVQSGKRAFFNRLGAATTDYAKNFIDSNARIDPSSLQHVYEWYQNGNSNARLFDIKYYSTGEGISFSSTFSQSTSIRKGSRVPFYDKARMMEYGIPVTISPKKSKTLVFEDDGETVFTKKDIKIKDPGGSRAQGGFEKAFDLFFNKYFSQAFLRSSGILDYLENPTAYKKNLQSGKRSGKSAGLNTGYRWIAQAGVLQNGE